MVKVLNLVVNGKVNTGVRHIVIGGNKGGEPMTNPEYTNASYSREVLSISKVINSGSSSKGFRNFSYSSSVTSIIWSI